MSQKIDAILRRMTVTEKVAQTRSVRLSADQDLSADETRAMFAAGIGAIQLPFPELTPADRVGRLNEIQGFLREMTRLGIPALVQDESLHGHLARDATSFPVPIGLASSWDRNLTRRIYSAIAAEVRARGGHTTHGPVLDLGRDPRWGRIEETWGEDSFFVSEMAVQMVSGLQGTDGESGLRDRGIVAACKHFAGYSASAGGRNFAPTPITRREFHAHYLRPFRRAVVEAGALGIMPSHCDVDGVPCHGNRALLTDLLRDEWGFEGIVVSDYHDASRLHLLHNVAPDLASAARLALSSGLDMDLPVGECYCYLEDLANDDPEVMRLLDIAVRRILDIKDRLGLFERSSVSIDGIEVIHCEPHRRLALEAAEKSIVLLTNHDGILPLRKRAGLRIGVFGPNADPLYTGAYSFKGSGGVSVLDGLRTLARDPVMEIHYAQGCAITKGTDIGSTELQDRIHEPELAHRATNERLIAEAAEIAGTTDVNIVCLGGNDLTSREAIFFHGSRGDRDSITLAGDQEELLATVRSAGAPVIVVILAGKPLAIPEVLDTADGVLYGWYAGEETGSAVAGIVFGDTNPSAKTAVTFARSVGQLPVYLEQNRTTWFKDYLFSETGPLVPFGFGLSYTTFEYSELSFDPDSRIVSVAVTNTGERAGDEIVQFYVTDVISSVVRPAKELRGFERVTLQPGESCRVSFVVTEQLLSYVNTSLADVYEPGEFVFTIGPDSVRGPQITVTLD